MSLFQGREREDRFDFSLSLPLSFGGILLVAEDVILLFTHPEQFIL